MKIGIAVASILFLAGQVASTNCPDRWIAFDGSCYLIGHGTKYSFLDAELFCRSALASHLVHVDSVLENEFLKSEFRAYKNDSFWMGLSDMRKEGTWEWYDTGSAPTFTDWFPGDPNSYLGVDEDCALFWELSNFEWVSAPCSTLAEPVCEIGADMPIIG